MPLLCFLAFVASLQLAMLHPILPDIAAGLGVSIPVVGQLVTATMFVGGLAVLITGMLSDIYGRKPCVVGGLGLPGMGTIIDLMLFKE
jgi:predicted MFS family arabinose efflux permease